MHLLPSLCKEIAINLPQKGPLSLVLEAELLQEWEYG